MYSVILGVEWCVMAELPCHRASMSSEVIPGSRVIDTSLLKCLCLCLCQLNERLLFLMDRSQQTPELPFAELSAVDLLRHSSPNTAAEIRRSLFKIDNFPIAEHPLLLFANYIRRRVYQQFTSCQAHSSAHPVLEQRSGQLPMPNPSAQPSSGPKSPSQTSHVRHLLIWPSVLQENSIDFALSLR